MSSKSERSRGWMWAMPPPASIWCLRGLELLRRAGDQQDDPARVGDLHRRGLADARRSAGDHDDVAARRLAPGRSAPSLRPNRSDLVRNLVLQDLAGSADEAEPALRGAGEGLVAVEVGVEVALPVVPELSGVGLERRHRDAGALQRGLRLPRVELGRPVHVHQNRTRDAEVGEHGVWPRCCPSGAVLTRKLRTGWNASVTPRGQPDRRLWRVRGLRERVDDLAGGHRVRDRSG